MTPPANAGSDPGLVVNSVSCVSAGNCAAVGDYSDRSGSFEGLLLSEVSGRWSRGVEAGLPATAGNGRYGRHAEITSVSCSQAGTCAAVGFYNDGSNNDQGLLLNATLLTPPPHNTTITHPAINRKRHAASFTFTATGATRFQCALIKPKQPGQHNKNPQRIYRTCTTVRRSRGMRP